MIEQTLVHIKSTKNMHVYGNETLQGIYIPKNLLPTLVPKTIKITITFEKTGA